MTYPPDDIPQEVHEHYESLVENDKLDRAVTIKVMGRICTSQLDMETGKDHLVFTPSTNAQHDYEVLCKVREEWTYRKQYEFCLVCDDRNRPRESEANKVAESCLYDGRHALLFYEPGDYALAALQVIEGEVG